MTLSNAYLVIGERPILVDTGATGSKQIIRKAMQSQSVDPRDLLETNAHTFCVGHGGPLVREAIHKWLATTTEAVIPSFAK